PATNRGTQFRERDVVRSHATPRIPVEIPMLRLLSVAALASAAIIATIATSSAAVLTMNSPRIGAVANVGRLAPVMPAPPGQSPHHEEEPRRWVCGPIKNWDGTWHCHWVS